MKNVLARHIILCTFCFFTIDVTAMDRSFRGSEEEVETEMYSVFPVGTHKTEVISTLKSKLEIDDTDMEFYSYGDEPFEMSKNGKKVLVYSWVRVIVARYRYLIFVKVAVEMLFQFDRDDKLNEIDVIVDMDSL